MFVNIYFWREFRNGREGSSGEKNLILIVGRALILVQLISSYRCWFLILFCGVLNIDSFVETFLCCGFRFGMENFALRSAYIFRCVARI